MQNKVERLIDPLAKVLSSWPGTECLTLGELAKTDTLDPYFALVFDLYYDGEIPDSETRRADFASALGDPGAFESSPSQAKDRFFIEGLPIRIEYKPTKALDDFLADPGFSGLSWILKNAGTYTLYRLQNSRILFSRSGWIDRAHKALAGLPEFFWNELRAVYQAKMEHSFSDLGAAILREDSYFYVESVAFFIKNAAALIFIENRKFMPSARFVDERLRALSLLPADFLLRWDRLLSHGPSPRQMLEHAEHIARELVGWRNR